MTARVLVVDDSALVRAMVRSELDRHGYEVVEAEDGPGALVAAGACTPDAVILDVEMPGLDGLGVLRAFRGDDRLAAVPVVFLSGRDSLGDAVAALEAGAHDYLTKPFHPAELLARVRAAVRVKQLTDELRRQNAELERVSRTDVLTGLPNRRHLEERLRAALSSAARHGGGVAVALVDVDRFKQVNDSLGHAAGDTVLAAVSARMGAALRTEDVLGRWGGEEFLAVMPLTDLAGVAVAGERLRAAVASAAVDVAGTALRVTVSVGGAVAQGGATAPDTVDDVVRRADVALYAAKSSGRDSVRVDGLGAQGPGGTGGRAPRQRENSASVFSASASHD